MSNMKCPFCNGELLLSSFRMGEKDYQMWNCLSCEFSAPRKIWDKIICKCKALEIAVDALDRMAIYDSICDIIARNAMKRIKALEQKD